MKLEYMYYKPPNIYNNHKNLEESFKSYLVHFYRWVYAWWLTLNCEKRNKKQLLKTNTTHKDLIVGSSRKTCWFKAFLQSPLSEIIVDESRDDWPALIRTRLLRQGSALINHRAKHSQTSKNRSEIWKFVVWSDGTEAELFGSVFPQRWNTMLSCCHRLRGMLYICSWPRGKKIMLTLIRFCKEKLLFIWLSIFCWACEHNSNHSSAKICSEGHTDRALEQLTTLRVTKRKNLYFHSNNSFGLL